MRAWNRSGCDARGAVIANNCGDSRGLGQRPSVLPAKRAHANPQGLHSCALASSG